MPEPNIAAPRSPEEAVARLRSASIPAPIASVTGALHRAGFAGVVVGGAVRDVLCGVEAGDWDVATSATPDEVQALFRRTIPTGVQHGTITVLSGSGAERASVEVTTFRGEAAYEDGRRPSAVRFLRELEDDLARRDLTINAFAWDPNTETFTDAFGGLQDLQQGVIRAVGDPKARFSEDGLRTIRALRFAASMGFVLHPATRDAIGGALEVFDRVSRERVRVELLKLLQARRPSLGLKPMVETGLWERVLGPWSPGSAVAIEAVDDLPCDPILRLARLLLPVDREEPGRVDAILEALKPSKEERGRVLALTGVAGRSLVEARGGVEIRRACASLGREHVESVLILNVTPPARVAEVEGALLGAALGSKELAIKGGDLIGAGIVQAGPEVGRVLARLVAWVIEDPSRNQAERLLDEARHMLQGD